MSIFNKKNAKYLVLAFLILLFLASELEWQLKNREPSLVKVGNDSFLFPLGFLVGQRTDVDDISFYINPITLKPKLRSEEARDLVWVTVLDSSRHPGSFFRREKGIFQKENNVKCSYKEDLDFRICQYTDVSLPEAPTSVTAYYRDNKLHLISRCLISGLPFPLCTDWGYFSPALKISYAYPAKYHSRIFEIDKAVKSMLVGFQQNAD